MFFSGPALLLSNLFCYACIEEETNVDLTIGISEYSLYQKFLLSFTACISLHSSEICRVEHKQHSFKSREIYLHIRRDYSMHSFTENYSD